MQFHYKKLGQFFLKPYDRFGGNVKVELDLSTYATKVDTSNLTSKSNLVKSKAGVDKIDIDNLKTVLANLSKLSNAVNNELVKKPVYNKLVAEVNAIDTSEFVLKIKYDIDKLDLDKKINDADNKIPNISGLVKKTDYNTKNK